MWLQSDPHPGSACEVYLRKEFVFLHVVEHHVYFFPSVAIYSLRFVWWSGLGLFEQIKPFLGM